MATIIFQHTPRLQYLVVVAAVLVVVVIVDVFITLFFPFLFWAVFALGSKSD